MSLPSEFLCALDPLPFLKRIAIFKIVSVGSVMLKKALRLPAIVYCHLFVPAEGALAAAVVVPQVNREYFQSPGVALFEVMTPI